MTDSRRIGPYRLIEPLKAGGMGDVYRAWDPRLQREIALKLLPPDFADSPTRRRRFVQEARVAGGLHHPNILAVYDVGDADTPFIASELLDGRDLRETIDRGPLPLRELFDLGAQMAAGLAAAHDAGIVHRDLKPENVVVTRDGRVKIIDFGLAKAAAPAEGGGSSDATETMPGTVLGTAQYMSPEQARGDQVDFRTDQFSLGLILYELATGVHPFRRDSAVQTLSAILSDEPPPMAGGGRDVPIVVRWIIERCLSKDPAARYASTADLHRDLALAQTRVAEVSASPVGRAVTASSRPRGAIVRAAVVIAVLLVGAVAAIPLRTDRNSVPRFTPLVTDGAFQGAPAWSPDNRSLAYVAPVNDVLQVFTRSVGPSQPYQVTTWDWRFDSNDPFWSPDSLRIFFHARAGITESLWSVSAAGGLPHLVARNATRTTISPDGTTLAFFREADESRAPSHGNIGLRRSIWLAASDGTDLRPYAEPPFDDREIVDGAIRFAPDGTKLLVWVWGWADDTSTRPTPEFWILPWPAGRPYRVLPSLTRSGTAAPAFDWFPDSRHIAIALWNDHWTAMHLWIADTSTGRAWPLASTPGSENRPAVTLGGQRIAFTNEAIDFDLIEIPLEGTPARALLSTSRNEFDPSFSRDGSQYVYVSDKNGTLQIWLRSRDGQWDRAIVGPEQFQGEATLTLGSLALSPGGGRIAFQRYSEHGGYQIFVSTVVGAGPAVLLAPGSLYQDGPTWSPDEEEIAFVHRTDDNIAALARVRLEPGSRPEIVLDGVVALISRPRWSPDGTWIACDTTTGLVIVTPDGRQVRHVSDDVWIGFEWSADSRTIYGLREADDAHTRYALVGVDIETLDERVINPDVGPIPIAAQPIRGLTRAGPTSLVTSVASARSEIWMLEGFAPPRGLWKRLFSRR